MSRRYSIVCGIFNDPASLNSMIGTVAFLTIGTVMSFNAKPLVNPTLVQQLVIPSVFIVGLLFACRWAYVLHDTFSILRTGNDATATVLDYDYDPGGSKLNRFGQATWVLQLETGAQLITETVEPAPDIECGHRIHIVVSTTGHRCLVASAFNVQTPDVDA